MTTQAGVSERRLGSVGELTPERLAELRRIAEAATKSDWTVAKTDLGHPCVRMPRPRKRLRPVHHIYPFDQEDAEHIAAFDPPTVLALLDEIERLRKAAIDPGEYGIDEPVVDWNRTAELRAQEIDRLRRVVEDAQSAPQRAQEWMRANGVQVADPSVPMQRAVFEVYNLLVELAQQAEAALSSAPATHPAARERSERAFGKGEREC